MEFSGNKDEQIIDYSVKDKNRTLLSGFDGNRVRQD